jgi:hypothetical protein
MKDLLTVRLGKKRAADLEAFCRKNGVSKADVVRNGIDEKIQEQGAGLPPVAARWAGKVSGPKATATNDAIRPKFRK